MKKLEGVDPARSAQMARVKDKNTKPEWRVRRALHAAGLRYTLHDPRLPGRPDLVFPSRRVVVFVHGCFWHRHPDPTCKLARLPKSRLDFWEPKLAANAARDERNTRALQELGWRVEILWECDLGPETLRAVAERVRATPPATGRINVRMKDLGAPLVSCGLSGRDNRERGGLVYQRHE
jgi:DNA mismatch endonuclease (patch repair protein)